ncbi:hypothetical protein F5Y17DRAFT_461370 [Xylariaceae sp. FL0594]|nr:hypothetical protein F5Y17DRAFT_461370 [Xylariaceae sp. FL0594]
MAALTCVPGASAVFRGGVVSYTTAVKREVLGVDAGLIEREGVVHSQVAAEMAEEGKVGEEEKPTTWGLATTGIAGPTEQDGKPVGTVFIGIASREGSHGLGPFMFPGSRDRIREATVVEALWQLRNLLGEQDGKTHVIRQIKLRKDIDWG